MLEGLLRSTVSFLLLVSGLLACLFGMSRSLALVRVTGESMHPALHAGDLCVIRRTHEAVQGDIVLYREDDHVTPILHRIVGTTDEGYVTRGDANRVTDFRPLEPRSIVGRMLVVVPVGAFLERWRGAGSGDTLHNQSHTARR